MAQTTTAINGCSGVIKVDNDSGVLQDVSGSANRIEMDRSLRMSDDIYTFGSAFPITKTCGKQAALNMRIVYSTEELEAMQLFNEWHENHSTDKRTVQIDMPDSNPGSDRYSFECYLQRIRTPFEAGDPNPVLVEIELKPTGTYTWANIGS